MDSLLHSPWTIAIVAPIVVAMVIYVLKLDRKEDDSKEKNSVSSNSSHSNNQVQKVVINNHVIKSMDGVTPPVKQEIPSSEVNLLKQEVRILFIDDLDLKKKIKNLKDAGWAKVTQLKDAPNIDIQEIREANVVFIDYKGIGEISSGEQGLSVLSALKHRYGEEKYLILYSAHDVPVEAFNRGANNYLSKNSTIYELEQKILEGILKIKK